MRRKQELYNHKIEAWLISFLHISFKYFSPADEIQINSNHFVFDVLNLILERSIFPAFL